ncbi:Major Facilitator Superfamily protein [Andreprevotia lacus DSM 23236]|jgi:MFS family permease|uniref:Major Facilitator Superfamily protein n=1 Tax=Andreprevotia lacus DSM 23236 TaxID=1121001 RepID=A0A1W1WX84_9NEIS|nr:MFS transporter [Andreprevotia lacus]SMC16339.1 Major Facilitator Superfamily protein [Andreprevotia lacus DSM 23236]
MSHAENPQGKWLVLGAVCLAGMMMPLSFTAPGIAIPAISKSLGGSALALAWVVNGFILSFGSAVMAAGALADRFGRKLMFKYGIIAFGLLSLLQVFVPNLGSLIALRALQGIAAATAMAGGSASLAHAFDGKARTQAYSLLGTSFGVGLAAGPVWAGFVIEQFGWRGIFLTSAVLSVLVVLFGVPRMHESRDPDAKGVDVWGTITFTVMLLLLTLGIMQGPQQGWDSWPVLGLLIGAVVALAVFIQVERLHPRSMLDLSLFRNRRFLGAQALPLGTAFSFVVPLIILPMRFIGIEGYGPVKAGLLMVPLSAPMLFVPFLGALLTRWLASSTLCAIGFAISAVGLFWLATVAPGAPAGDFVLPLLLMGTGAGLPWGLMDDLAISVVAKERAGMATGFFATVRVAGESLSLAIVGAILVGLLQAGLNSRLGSDAPVVALGNALAAADLPQAHALYPLAGQGTWLQIYGGAVHDMTLALAVLTILSGAVAFLTLRRAPAHAAPAASRLAEANAGE